VRAVKRKRKKVSSLSVSSAEMHNASLIPGSSNSASTGTESIKEQTSRCGQSVDTSDSESELQDCSFVFAGSSDTVGTEMEPSGRYSSAREPCGTGIASAKMCASEGVSRGQGCAFSHKKEEEGLFTLRVLCRDAQLVFEDGIHEGADI
jgi:hypothetical protein